MSLALADKEMLGSMYVSRKTAHLPLTKPNIFPETYIDPNALS